jgi:hypothetical protein
MTGPFTEDSHSRCGPRWFFNPYSTRQSFKGLVQASFEPFSGFIV